MKMKRLIPIFFILSLLLSLISCSGNYGEVDLKKPVPLSEEGIVEKELLDKIKNENAIATFTGNSGGLDYEWTIFGSDLHETKDINLLVTLEKADGGIKMSFADSEPFGFPALLLAIHWLCVVISTADPHHKNYHPKMIRLMFWICPMIGLILCTMVYSAALGHSVPIETIMPLLLGMLFVVIGNLMPKCRYSYTMGIKLPWTLHSEENWNRTHRFGGKVWVIGGIIMMATALWGSFWLLMAIVALMVLIPTIYSYLYYRNHEQEKQDGN